MRDLLRPINCFAHKLWSTNAFDPAANGSFKRRKSRCLATNLQTVIEIILRVLLLSIAPCTQIIEPPGNPGWFTLTGMSQCKR